MKRLALLTVVAASFAPPAKAHFTSHCKKDRCKRHVVAPFKSKLIRMARCESGLRWYLHNGYEGGLQFASSTWDATGSKYSAAYLAPPLEQMYRAVIWRFKIGTWVTTAGWPVCGYK